jgi:hypothetical protein
MDRIVRQLARLWSLKVIALSLGLAYLAARLWIAFGGRVFTSFDTFSYAYRTDPAFNRGDLVSFTGHAPRTWGAPLFFAIFPDDQSRAIGQWAVGTIAWALLAGVVWTCLRSLAARAITAAGILLLGLMPQITNHDFAILSESLSISLGVVVLALLLWWLRTGRRWALVVMSVIAVWWTFVRPELVLMLGLIILVLAVRAWRDRRPAPAVAAGTLALAALWTMMIVPTVNDTFPGWSSSRLNLDEETLTYRLRHQVLPHPEIKAVFRTELGMPECAAADEIAAGTEWRMIEFADAYRGCPELKAWGEQNAKSSGYQFALAAPDLYAGYVLRVLPWSLVGVVHADVPTVAPALLQRAFYQPGSVVLPFLLGGSVLLVTLIVFSGALRRRRLLTATALLLLPASAVSILAGLMYSAGEYERFGMQEGAGIRIALLLMAGAVLDSWLERRRDRQAPAGQDERSSTSLDSPLAAAQA